MNQSQIVLLLAVIPALFSCSSNKGTNNEDLSSSSVVASSTSLSSSLSVSSSSIALSDADQAQFDLLFAPPTESELDAQRAKFGTVDVSAINPQLVEQGEMGPDLNGQNSRYWIISHMSDGYIHYGAVVFPEGVTDSLPVLLQCHWGDGGIALDADFRMMLLMEKGLSRQFVHVVPSFRSESITNLGRTWTSTGAPSPWDRDIFDALRLVAAAESLTVHPPAVLTVTPKIKQGTRRVIGFSRGGGVALLVALNDKRYTRVADYFGPTDFYGEFVQNVFRKLVTGTVPDLPGVDFLNAAVVSPYHQGTLTLDSARSELLRRSPARFASDLPPVMIHHGDADTIVPVSQAEDLWKAILKDGSGTTVASSRLFIYPGAGHSPFGMVGKIDSTISFLSESAGGALIAGAKRSATSIDPSVILWLREYGEFR